MSQTHELISRIVSEFNAEPLWGQIGTLKNYADVRLAEELGENPFSDSTTIEMLRGSGATRDQLAGKMPPPSNPLDPVAIVDGREVSLDELTAMEAKYESEGLYDRDYRELIDEGGEPGELSYDDDDGDEDDEEDDFDTYLSSRGGVGRATDPVGYVYRNPIL